MGWRRFELNVISGGLEIWGLVPFPPTLALSEYPVIRPEQQRAGFWDPDVQGWSTGVAYLETDNESTQVEHGEIRALLNSGSVPLETTVVRYAVNREESSNGRFH